MSGSRNLADFYVYDPAADRWKRIADYPGGGCRGAFGASDASCGFCGLGFDGRTIRKDWWRFDDVGNSWRRQADFPAAPRSGGVAFVIGKDIYIGSGLATGSSLQPDYWRYTE